MSRLAGMLARKGYPSGLTMQVVRAALAADVDGSVWTGQSGDEGGGDVDLVALEAA